MAGWAAILDAMADTIRDAIDGIDWDIQVEPWIVINPSPLTVDMFPADPPTDETYGSMGEIEGEKLVTVRARSNTPDEGGARDAILSLMDIEDEHSVTVALMDDRTLGGLVGGIDVRGGTGLSQFPAADGMYSLIGVQWTVLVLEAGS